MAQDLFKEFSMNVHRIRTAAGLSQMMVAERMGTDQGNYSRLESGVARPTLATIHRLSEALGCEPYELLLPGDMLPLIEAAKPLRARGKGTWSRALDALQRLALTRSSS